ncbi:MAG: ABC-type phosphate transport system substrate-binding protein [Oleispira sp.]|jgi:ABC-type phosphate transport system substrate-binding protein
MHNVTKYLMALTLCLVALFSPASQSDVVVVVNIDNPINQLTKSQVIDLFMGKYIAFPNGMKASTVDMSDASNIKKIFYQQLVGMSLARVNSFWSRIKFTGRAKPPLKQPNEDAVVSFIALKKDAIAYISRSKINTNLKVVYQFNE